jgi:hypothetical protein
MEVRYGRLHNISMAVVAAGMIGTALLLMAQHPDRVPRLSFSDPRFDLYLVLGLALATYAWLGLSRTVNRAPQVVIDCDGIALGFGRNRRFTWDEIEWVRLHRLAIRPQLQIGLAPQAFVEANLRLSMWNLDDGLKPIRGVPAAVLLRDNGLDARAAAMLDAVKSFRPNLVRP